MIEKIKFHLVLGICNHVLRGTRFFELKRKLLNCIGVKVGSNTRIVGPINMGSMVKLEIKNNNWIGTNLTIHGNGSVKIGNNNDFAPDVTIITGSHRIGNSKRRAGQGISYEYLIGDGNWIGAKTTLLNGCNVGYGVVIGACSLVTKNTENNALYIGIPATKYKELIDIE